MPTKVYFQKSSFNSKKAWVALALAVSLWIGGAGLYAPLASADTGTGQTTVVTDANTPNGHDVYGNHYGMALDNTNNVGPPRDNTITVELTSKTLKNVYGAWTNNGGTSNPVSGNVVNIYSGVMITVYGGYSQRVNSSVTGNTVNIYGGTIRANVYGGATDNLNGSSVTYNTVNIYGGTIRGRIIGGEAATVSNNTLNVAGKGISAGYVKGFDKLNFFIPVNMTRADTMLNITEGSGTGQANVTNAKIGVMAQGKLPNLAKGDKVTLLHAFELTGGDTIQQATDTEIEVPKSIATVDTYKFKVTSDTNNIYATITEAPPDESGGDDNGNGGNGGNGNGDNGGNGNGGNNDNGNGGNDNGKATEAHENTKSIAETKAATTTFINAGADMLASQGFEQAANAVALEMAAQSKGGGAGAPAVSSFTPFAAMGGSSMRAESGSYVDTKGFGLNLGFAREVSNSQGKLLFGPVVEYGGGSYDSYLDNGTHGEGGSHYFGVGIMARQINKDGFYYEGSLRGGRVTSDYKSSFKMRNNLPNDINYDSASNYLAAHVGVGKVYDMGHNDTLDGYLKYFYSHQAGDNVTIHATSGDEQWSFDAVNSHRIRIGARLTHKVNEKTVIMEAWPISMNLAAMPRPTIMAAVPQAQA